MTMWEKSASFSQSFDCLILASKSKACAEIGQPALEQIIWRNAHVEIQRHTTGIASIRALALAAC